PACRRICHEHSARLAARAITTPLRCGKSAPIQTPVGVPRPCGLVAPTTTMGRPSNEDPSRRAAPVAGPSKRALRMLVSALAGGGLTAAGLGALVGPALGAESAPIGTPGEGTLGSGQAAGDPEAMGTGGPGQGSAEQP